MILALEAPPLLMKLYILTALSIVFLVRVDKKVMFHNVLFIEYNLCHGKYSRKVSFIPTLCQIFQNLQEKESLN